MKDFAGELRRRAARRDGSRTSAEHGTPGIRLVIPWHTEGLPPGEVTPDFAGSGFPRRSCPTGRSRRSGLTEI